MIYSEMFSLYQRKRTILNWEICVFCARPKEKKRGLITPSLNQIWSFICKNKVQKQEQDSLGQMSFLSGGKGCACHCECVRLVRARSRRGMATLLSRCHWGVVTCGGGVSTLWATPGAFSSDHNSSPRVTMETRSSSSAHQATDPPLVTALSLERNSDTLKKMETHSNTRDIHLSESTVYMCGFQSPGYQVMWPRRQLSQSAHEGGDDSGRRANRSSQWGGWSDLKQHCLQWLKTGSDETHRAARVTWHRQVFSQHPHLRAKWNIILVSSLGVLFFLSVIF